MKKSRIPMYRFKEAIEVPNKVPTFSCQPNQLFISSVKIGALFLSGYIISRDLHYEI